VEVAAHAPARPVLAVRRVRGELAVNEAEKEPVPPVWRLGLDDKESVMGMFSKGLFSKPASGKEKRAFARGTMASGKAAEAYAREKKRKAEFAARKRAAARRSK
jgi:hypothetical protein